MEPQSPFDSPPAEPNGQADIDIEPKFGIVHLLGWTACVAILFGLQETVSNWAIGGQPLKIPNSALHSLQRILRTLISGAAVGSLGMLAVRRWRAMPFPRHPGEFLASMLGAVALAQLAVSALNVWVMRYGAACGTWLMRHGTVLFYLFPVLVIDLSFALWAVRKTRERWWRIFFIGFAVMVFVECGLFFLFTLDVLGGVWQLWYVSVFVLLLQYIWLPLLLPLAIAIWDDKCRGYGPPLAPLARYRSSPREVDRIRDSMVIAPRF